MIVTALRWAKVTVTYDRPVASGSEKPRQSDTFKDAYVQYRVERTVDSPIKAIDYNPKELYSRTLSIGEPYPRDDNHLLLGRAELVHLSPFSAEFVAYWFGSGPNGKVLYVRAAVTCDF